MKQVKQERKSVPDAKEEEEGEVCRATRDMDEFIGQGGSYVIDPQTGRRQLVERTRDPGE